MLGFLSSRESSGKPENPQVGVNLVSNGEKLTDKIQNALKETQENGQIAAKNADKINKILEFNKELTKSYINTINVTVNISKILNEFSSFFDKIKSNYPNISAISPESIQHLEQFKKENMESIAKAFKIESENLFNVFKQFQISTDDITQSQANIDNLTKLYESLNLNQSGGKKSRNKSGRNTGKKPSKRATKTTKATKETTKATKPKALKKKSTV